MKKGSLIILSVLAILALVVWFSCNPFAAGSQKSSSLNILDETEMIKATGISGGFGDPSGGEGGATVYASDYDTFKSYTDSNDTLIIYVTGSFNLAL